MNFFGREYELAELERSYQSDKFEFTVIYGRRRVGKTFLIQKYIEDKDSIYYMASRTGGLNLERLSLLVNEKLGLGNFGPVYKDYFTLFQAIGKMAQDKRVVFVIDEYPYLAESNEGISSIIQAMCDHDWKKSKLHLILCGSSMSFMEKQVLSAKSPLYGRRTSQIRVKPFTFFETKEMLEGMDKEDIAIIHSATGGVAEYLSYVDKSIRLEENLVNLFLKPSGRLFEEPINLLNQELKSPEVYNRIIYAVANGANKNIEISNQTGIPSGSLSPYLKNLTELEIIKKEVPYGESSGRKTLYRIKDGCFRFYFRYVLRFQSQIIGMNGERIYNEFIREDLSNFMGEGFEDISYDFFEKLNKEDKLFGFVHSYGRWWGNNPLEKKEEEIDLLGEGKGFSVFGEFKWRNRDFDMGELDKLINKSRFAPVKQSNSYYIIFTKKDFSRDVENLLKKEKRIIGYSFVKDF